jgi:hypothetical protein
MVVGSSRDRTPGASLSDEKADLYEEILGQQVMIQLRAYPYIGINADLQPMYVSGQLATTPVILGAIVNYDDQKVQVETTDPGGDPQVKIYMIINRADLGPITLVRREATSLIV